GVPLDDLGVRPGGGLVAADAADPREVRLQRPVERLDLAQEAAQVGVAAEQARPEVAVLLLDGAGRADVDHVDVVDLLDGVAGADRLGEVVAGVDEQHVQAGLDRADQVDQQRVAHGRRQAEPVDERGGGTAYEPALDDARSLHFTTLPISPRLYARAQERLYQLAWSQASPRASSPLYGHLHGTAGPPR